MQSSLKNSWVFLKHRQSQRRGSDGRKLSLDTSRRTSMTSFYNGGLKTDCTVNTMSNNSNALPEEMNGDIKLNTFTQAKGRHMVNNDANNHTSDLVKCCPNAVKEMERTATPNSVRSTNLINDCVLSNRIRNGNIEKLPHDKPDALNAKETKIDTSEENK